MEGKMRGNRLLKRSRFPRTPSGKNFYMAGGRVSRITNVGQAFQPAGIVLMGSPIKRLEKTGILPQRMLSPRRRDDSNGLYCG